jgi:hypothetical protein
MTAKHPNITVQLTGTDGNAFAVLGQVNRALRQAGIPQVEGGPQTASQHPLLLCAVKPTLLALQEHMPEHYKRVGKEPIDCILLRMRQSR